MTILSAYERKRRGKFQHEDPGNFQQEKNKTNTQRMIMILAIITGFRYWPKQKVDEILENFETKICK